MSESLTQQQRRDNFVAKLDPHWFMNEFYADTGEPAETIEEAADDLRGVRDEWSFAYDRLHSLMGAAKASILEGTERSQAESRLRALMTVLYIEPRLPIAKFLESEYSVESGVPFADQFFGHITEDVEVLKKLTLYWDEDRRQVRDYMVNACFEFEHPEEVFMNAIGHFSEHKNKYIVVGEVITPLARGILKPVSKQEHPNYDQLHINPVSSDPRVQAVKMLRALEELQAEGGNKDLYGISWIINERTAQMLKHVRLDTSSGVEFHFGIRVEDIAKKNGTRKLPKWLKPIVTKEELVRISLANILFNQESLYRYFATGLTPELGAMKIPHQAFYDSK